MPARKTKEEKEEIVPARKTKEEEEEVAPAKHAKMIRGSDRSESARMRGNGYRFAGYSECFNLGHALL